MIVESKYVCYFSDNKMLATKPIMLPQVAALWHGTSNATVVDRVPPEMLHLVDAHW
jgi:hypothetical protein